MTTNTAAAEAITARDIARIAFQTATTKKASNEAAEELEFWVGKVAFLTAAR